ncbi:MAG: DegT/DnrJ/EryC1/StrS family aminotransferase [Solirubrobacterales bacterium]|nr:DegT/DnrJ/EryC1/StrS family aminotransferase [Solirubrobacterales bacterium]
MTVRLFDPSTPLRPLRAELREAVTRVLDSERYILGPEVQAFEDEFADHLGVRHAIGVANGTDAITIALRALGVGPGDEVVVPSFSFWASAEAIPPIGATPVFCDVDPETSCVTVDSVRAAVTAKTKAIIAVHLFGNVAPVKAIEEELGLPVVEDAAQAAGSLGPDGRPGSLGSIATFSFYPSKNLGAFGDGGAVTTGDGALAERVKSLRFHGSRDKVSYEDVGYNSRLDELQAAILRVQLPQLDRWSDHRRAAASWYASALDGVVGLPVATRGASPAWHLYVIRHPQPDALADHLHTRGIECRGYYRRPIHEQPAMAGYTRTLPLPGTDVAAAQHLAIPISAAITRDEVDEVSAAIREFCG